MMNPFYAQVYAVVKKIPYGKVVSYGKIAAALNRPRSSREVGRAMRICPDDIPWQRVVMSDGSIAGGDYANRRKELLIGEGVILLSNGRVDMKNYAIDPIELEFITLSILSEIEASEEGATPWSL